jgi:tRNA nucleotidyltransferase/poly(A) polymerase
MELEAVLVNPDRARGAKMLFESGLAEVIFPGLAGEKIKKAVKVLSQMRRKVDFALALAGLFADCETVYAIKKCGVLKLSRDTTRHVKFLLVNRDKLLDEKMSLAKLKLTASEPYFGDLYELQRAIQKADGKSTAPLIKLRKRIKALRGVELRPKPLLDGHDLMRLGAVSGPLLGQLSQEMYIAQLEGKLQRKEQAEKWAVKWLVKHSEISK